MFSNQNRENDDWDHTQENTGADLRPGHPTDVALKPGEIHGGGYSAQRVERDGECILVPGRNEAKHPRHGHAGTIEHEYYANICRLNGHYRQALKQVARMPWSLSKLRLYASTGKQRLVSP